MLSPTVVGRGIGQRKRTWSLPSLGASGAPEVEVGVHICIQILSGPKFSAPLAWIPTCPCLFCRAAGLAPWSLWPQQSPQAS